MPLGPFGDIGPCQLNWNAWAITSIHEDGCTFRCTMNTAPVKEAEYGLAEVDSVATGYEPVEFESPFTRITFGNLQRLLPGSDISGGSIASGIVTLQAGAKVGTPLYDLSHELIVKRIVNGIVDTDTKRWLHLFKAYPIPRFDIPFNLSGQRAFMVLWKVYPLQAAGAGDDKVGATWRVGGPESYVEA